MRSHRIEENYLRTKFQTRYHVFFQNSNWLNYINPIELLFLFKLKNEEWMFNVEYGAPIAHVDTRVRANPFEQIRECYYKFEVSFIVLLSFAHDNRNSHHSMIV